MVCISSYPYRTDVFQIITFKSTSKQTMGILYRVDSKTLAKICMSVQFPRVTSWSQSMHFVPIFYKLLVGKI